MPSQVINHQCPACTGPLHFVGSSGKLECDYCGSSYDVAEIEALYAQKEKTAAETFASREKEAREQGDSPWDTSGIQEDWGAEGAGMRAYSCPSCGAELLCDASTAAASCPYCGNPTVVPGQFRGVLRPDFLIPFRLDKEQATAALRRHCKGKFLLPKAFSNEHHIQQLQGVYVPFWLFDGQAEGTMTFHATRSHTHRSGNQEITRTDHYQVLRSGFLSFEKVPVDASRRMPDDLMDSIEPYDYQDLTDFSTAFLPGFLADKYDVTAEESRERADRRCANTLYSALEATVGPYHTRVPTGSSASIRKGKVHYALLPVWLLNTQWGGKNYLFAMNGQTGKLVGDLPISWGKFWGLFAGIFLPLSLLGTVLSLLLV